MEKMIKALQQILISKKNSSNLSSGYTQKLNPVLAEMVSWHGSNAYA